MESVKGLKVFITWCGKSKKNQPIDTERIKNKGNKMSSRAPTSFSASTNPYEESSESKNNSVPNSCCGIW